MELEKVVPWGRSFKEYQLMFNLTDDDLNKRILGCGDGPANFNAEMTKNHKSVVSVDPVYQFSASEIRARIDEVAPNIAEQLSLNKQNYIWSTYPNVETLVKDRLSAMDVFLDDFEQGKKEKRYIYGELPQLSFEDDAFDLALVSHFLFLYSEHFDLDFHLQSLFELCRVSNEVRIYPLVDLVNKPSCHLEEAIDVLNKQGFITSLEKVNYAFQKGAINMLKIKK